jgi:aminopeptidase
VATDQVLTRLAQLLVELGANVQPGQVVSLASEPGKEPLTRAIAEAAYQHGAKYVDLAVFDPHLKRARALYAAEETLGYVPPWVGARTLALGEHRCATIALTGTVEPHLMDGVDPDRLGKDMLPRVKESNQLLNDRSVNWTIGPCPTAGWAQLVHPDLEPAAALVKLWEEIAHVCRLDEDDPLSAWQARLEQLARTGQELDSRRFDALHFEGTGTDLVVGLLPGSRWKCGRFSTADGIPHAPNLPTEEVFTSPDPERTEGVVRSTKPLFVSGTLITGLSVRFEGGGAVLIEADQNAETLRALAARDEGAPRLGEVALVDRQSRIGKLDTVFYDTLLDENAASHIALGQGFEFAVEGEEDVARVNRSEIHIDFMIGGDEVAVTGITAEGERVPVLRGGDWQI